MNDEDYENDNKDKNHENDENDKKRNSGLTCHTGPKSTGVCLFFIGTRKRVGQSGNSLLGLAIFGFHAAFQG